MQLRADKQIVPVLMFHSVGLEDHPWVWAHLSESAASFESKLQLLRERGFRSVFWQDVYDYMNGKSSLPPNPIMLTFDDGYLDNWVFVYPLLRKYGFCATVFMTTDFVDPAPTPRPTLEDVWAGRISVEQLKAAGFLSWAEMREMEASGVIDVQSHAQTHTWYFSSSTIVDFHHPQPLSSYPWLFWNSRPERKPFYLNEDQQAFVPWGHPILEHEKSLTVRRFVPEQEAAGLLTSFVESMGGRDFFGHGDWRKGLEAYTRESFGGLRIPGVHETAEQQKARIRNELAESKGLLESELGKRVNFICWPGGGNDTEVRALARDAGYKAWTLGSKDKGPQRNKPGADPTALRRIGTANTIRVKGRDVGTGGASYQLMRINAHRGSSWAQLQLRGRQLIAMVRERR